MSAQYQHYRHRSAWKVTDVQNKAGFDVPLARWLREDLAPMMRDLLVPSKLASAGIVDTRRVEHYIARHMAGDNRYALRLWTLLVLAQWDDAQVAVPQFTD